MTLTLSIVFALIVYAVVLRLLVGAAGEPAEPAPEPVEAPVDVPAEAPAETPTEEPAGEQPKRLAPAAGVPLGGHCGGVYTQEELVVIWHQMREYGRNPPPPPMRTTGPGPVRRC